MNRSPSTHLPSSLRPALRQERGACPDRCPLELENLALQDRERVTRDHVATAQQRTKALKAFRLEAHSKILRAATPCYRKLPGARHSHAPDPTLKVVDRYDPVRDPQIDRHRVDRQITEPGVTQTQAPRPAPLFSGRHPHRRGRTIRTARCLPGAEGRSPRHRNRRLLLGSDRRPVATGRRSCSPG